jgi:hypothetical protein
MSNNHAAVSDDRDFFVRQLAAAEERDRLRRGIVPILDCWGSPITKLPAYSATRPTS